MRRIRWQTNRRSSTQSSAARRREIWLAFRDQHYPNIPDVVVDNYVLHYILIAAGALVALVLFLSVTVFYMMSTVDRGYERYANPSPDHGVDGPYNATVELIPPA